MSTFSGLAPTRFPTARLASTDFRRWWPIASADRSSQTAQESGGTLPMNTYEGWAYAGTRYTMYRFPEAVLAKIRKLNEPDNWHFPLAWLEDMAWIAACIAACLTVSMWLYPLAVLIIGARQRGLSTILHDCAHNVGFRT